MSNLVMLKPRKITFRSLDDMISLYIQLKEEFMAVVRNSASTEMDCVDADDAQLCMYHLHSDFYGCSIELARAFRDWEYKNRMRIVENLQKGRPAMA